LSSCVYRNNCTRSKTRVQSLSKRVNKKGVLTGPTVGSEVCTSIRPLPRRAGAYRVTEKRAKRAARQRRPMKPFYTSRHRLVFRVRAMGLTSQRSAIVGSLSFKVHRHLFEAELSDSLHQIHTSGGSARNNPTNACTACLEQVGPTDSFARASQASTSTRTALVAHITLAPMR
jgi:hypothetical protein